MVADVLAARPSKLGRQDNEAMMSLVIMVAVENIIVVWAAWKMFTWLRPAAPTPQATNPTPPATPPAPQTTTPTPQKTPPAPQETPQAGVDDVFWMAPSGRRILHTDKTCYHLRLCKTLSCYVLCKDCQKRA